MTLTSTPTVARPAAKEAFGFLGKLYRTAYVIKPGLPRDPLEFTRHMRHVNPKDIFKHRAHMLSSWLTRIVDGLARLQVLKSAASLHLLLHFWQPLDGTEIWTLPTGLCLVVFALG